MAKCKVRVHYRNADDWQYVTREYAERHPKTTVRETDKVRK